MFKPGDRVKYIIDGKYDNVTINNVYIVLRVYFDSYNNEYLSIVDDSGVDIKNLLPFRFELYIRDKRKEKLKKLNGIHN